MTFVSTQEIPHGFAKVYDPETGCMFVFRRQFPCQWDDLGYGIVCDIFSVEDRKVIETAIIPASGSIWNVWNSTIVDGKVTTLLGPQVFTYSYPHNRWNSAECCDFADGLNCPFAAIHELGKGMLIAFESGQPMRYTRRETPHNAAWTVVPGKIEDPFRQCIKVM